MQHFRKRFTLGGVYIYIYIGNRLLNLLLSVPPPVPPIRRLGNKFSSGGYI